MKKNNVTTLLSLLIMLALFSQCKKEDSNPNQTGTESTTSKLFRTLNQAIEFEEYYSFYTQDIDGDILFQSPSSPYTIDLSHSAQASIDGNNQPKNANFPNGVKVTFNDHWYVPGIDVSNSNGDHPAPNYSIIYGKRLSVSYSNNEMHYSIDPEGEFYNPELIQLIPQTNQDFSTIHSGTTIFWNADNNNTNGVVILLSYEPSGFQNNDFNNSRPNEIFKAANVTDNGSYTFTEDDFSNMPLGASLKVRIGRVGMYTYNTTELKHSFAAVSSCTIESEYTVN